MNRLLLTITAFGLVIWLTGCGNESNTNSYSSKIDSLRNVVQQLQTQVDSFRIAIDRIDSADFNWYHPDYEGRSLQKQGIEHPEKFIIDSLKNRPELIPLDPVMGGSMRVTHVEVLSGEWAIAAYEDGHIMGRALFRYTIDSDRNITFEIIESTRL